MLHIRCQRWVYMYKRDFSRPNKMRQTEPGLVYEAGKRRQSFWQMKSSVWMSYFLLRCGSKQIRDSLRLGARPMTSTWREWTHHRKHTNTFITAAWKGSGAAFPNRLQSNSHRGGRRGRRWSDREVGVRIRSGWFCIDWFGEGTKSRVGLCVISAKPRDAVERQRKTKTRQMYRLRFIGADCWNKPLYKI